MAVNAMLDRLTFGAQASEVSAVARGGLSNWVRGQLSPNEDDLVVDQVLRSSVLRISYPASSAAPPDYPAVNENRPLTCLNQATEQLWSLTNNKRKIAHEERVRPLREAAASKLIHARYSRWQLRAQANLQLSLIKRVPKTALN